MQKSYISVDGKDADRACGGHPFCINLHLILVYWGGVAEWFGRWSQDVKS